jgi:adenosylcobinamide-GDP ribazoletransferase
VNTSGLRQAVGFLTVVPGSPAFTPSMVPWFPVVGAALGAGLGGVWWAAGEAFPAGPAAVLVLVVDLALTGALHHDGLLDSADGLLPHMARERRLEVMREPTVGAFAVMAAVAVGLVVWSSMASMAPAPLLVVALWALSRATAGLVLLRVGNARGDGLAAAVAPTGGTVALAGQALLAVAAAVVWDPVPGLLAGAGVLVAAGAVVALARRRIGGVTGDVLGALIVTGQALGLLLATVG